MRKLNILKAIADFIWMLSLITFPFVLILATYFILSDELIDLPFKISGNSIDLTSPFGKIAFVIAVLNFGTFLYALFFFRKLLTNFKKHLIFENENTLLFDKIGNLVLLGSVIYLVADFIANTSINKVEIHLGYGPFVYLLGLGLFFKVLSEVFKLGKKLKEENELTI